MSALLHFRIKRGSETIFMLVEPSDSFGKLRTQTAKIVGKPTADVQLIAPDKETVLPDTKLATEAVTADGKPLPDDSVLYLVFRTGGESFEKIQIEDITLPGE